MKEWVINLIIKGNELVISIMYRNSFVGKTVILNKANSNTNQPLGNEKYLKSIELLNLLFIYTP